MGKCKRCGKEVKFPIMLHSTCWELEVQRVAEKIFNLFPSDKNHTTISRFTVKQIIKEMTEGRK